MHEGEFRDAPLPSPPSWDPPSDPPLQPGRVITAGEMQIPPRWRMRCKTLPKARQEMRWKGQRE